MSAEQETRTHRPLSRPQLRLALRQQRKAVPKSIANAAAYAVARSLTRLVLTKGLRIAVYAAFDGEIDLSQVVRQAQRMNCTVYTPRIVNMRARRMEFIELTKQNLGRGRGNSGWTLQEPRCGLHRRLDPRLLDIVLLPLVAFDARGWRLGFGAGFYDRKLSFLRRRFVHKPILIGIGYEFQRVPVQVPSPWDISLDAVVTERGFSQCHPQHIHNTPRQRTIK